MTRTRILAAAAAGSLALAVGGCVTLKRTPDSRFFVLDALVEPAGPVAASEPLVLVGVVPVRLPGHLRRPQLVGRAGSGEVRIDEFARWAEPLEAGVTRVVAENLASLLPAHSVVLHPWPASALMRCRVAVSVRTLSQQADGWVHLEGRFALLPARDERPLLQRTLALRRGPLPAAAPPEALVQAMNELLADLSRAIAAALRELPAEEGEGRAASEAQRSATP